MDELMPGSPLRQFVFTDFHFFDFVHSSAFAPILALSVIMMLLYVGWLYMAQFLYFGRFGIDPPVSLSAFVSELLTTQRGMALALYGNVVGFLFAFTVLAISVFALTAISASVRAVITNLWVMAVWGVVVVALLTVGAALLLVGLAAVLPILGHATWHLYRKVVQA